MSQFMQTPFRKYIPVKPSKVIWADKLTSFPIFWILVASTLAVIICLAVAFCMLVSLLIPRGNATMSVATTFSSPIPTRTAPTMVVAQIIYPTPTLESAARPDPSDLIYRYFTAINNGDYQTAWSMLTDHFINTHNRSGYGPYADWWATVERVVILSVVVNTMTDYSSNITVELSYYYVNGQIDTYDQMNFSLIWDQSKNDWRIDDATLLRGTR